uniref:Right handed beta helix domain-containing protein n=1 Tax=Amphimedon queenslandica TaxID=400682 RepID=A0A1X7U7C1_AMPQE
MALVILLLFAFFVNEAQAKCSQSASLSVFLLQSNSPIEAGEITNLTDIRNGLGYEEDEPCCLYYVEDNEGNGVNVTACKDTEIDTALDAINTTEYHHHVLVLGKEGTSLNYTLHETRSISGYSNDNYKLSMTLLGRGSPTIQLSKISFNHFHNISITNVSFVEGMIILTDIQNIQLTSVTIRDSPLSGLLIKKGVSYSRVTISSCNFINNTNLNTTSSQGGGLSINFDNVYMEKIVIEDSQFTGNKATIGGGLGIAVQYISSLTISGCSFTDNTAHRDGGGLWLSSMYQYSFKFNVTETHFTSNTASTNGGGAYIMIQNAYLSDQNIIFVSFHNVQWISNIARLSSAIKLHTHSIKKLSAVISDNTFECNSAGPKQYLSGSTTCSLYSDGFNIILKKTNFTSNKAAGVCAQNAKISIPTNALFCDNTAYKGAGIYLDDDSYLELGPHSYLNFTRNSALYGAGIYQKSVTKTTLDATSSTICFINKTQDSFLKEAQDEDPFLFFQDNIAIISGKAIYFNDPDPDQNRCESELESLNIEYDDDTSRDQQITSSAIYVSFSGNIEDNETTLILGQRLVFNASVTGIFDKETFALVSIILLPPDGNLYKNINYNLAHETSFTIETGKNRPNLRVKGPELKYSQQYLFIIARGCVCQEEIMALVIVLLLFAFFVNEAVEAQAECSQSASLSVFLLQSSSPIEADEINNLTDIRNGLGYEEDESCCLYYVEDNEGNDVNVTACKDTEIDTALDAINTTEYYHHVLVLGNEGTSLNYTLHEIWNVTGCSNNYYKLSITLIGRGSPTIKFPEISLKSIKTVNITNVSFIEGMINLTDIQNIQLTSVTIHNSPSTGLLIMKDVSNIIISSCNFINNSLNTTSSQGGGLSIINGSVYKIVLEDSQFTGNKATIGGGLDINVEYIDSLTISGCSFTDNTAHRDGGGLWINAVYNNKFNISNTNFTRNMASKNGGGAYIVIQNVFIDPGQQITGSFYNVQWVSNTAPSSPAMKLTAHDSGKLSSKISSNIFKWNSAGPKQYLSGSTTCSLYSDGFNVILEETNFISNKAAGVCAQSAKISIPTNALFYNNTAYKGAGIHLDGDSYLELGPHSYLNFTRNSALYGAGIYQKSVTKSTLDATSTICFLNKTRDSFLNETQNEDPFLFFQDNIATVSGKAIFFNDPDPDNNRCELELDSLNIEYDDDDSKYQQITSLAINISFSGNIEDNKITLILGQRLVLNASVTDLFNNEISALSGLRDNFLNRDWI